MLTHPPRAFPWETDLPWAPTTLKESDVPRPEPAARARPCLNKECGRKYQPRCWNQRFCQEPECQRQVDRWRAALRQAKRRRDAKVQAQHAEAERVRRQQAKAASQAVPKPDVTPARGHAAKIFFPSVMQPTRLPRTPRELAPQFRTLLLSRLPASCSQCPGS